MHGCLRHLSRRFRLSVRHQRWFYSCRMSGKASLPMIAQEVQFPVPWGHIAGKAWGDPAGRPVLALHGWLDNASSFDKLIPLLSNDYYIVAIDWPGHGLSSHRPKGSLYHACDYVADIKYVVDEMKWEKFMFLAHSMGAAIGSWFAAALPDRVEAMVLLDAIGHWPMPEDDLPKMMAKELNSLSIQEGKDLIYPTWSDVIDKLVEAHLGIDKNFGREAAATLAVRGTRQSDDGQYQFTRDLRLLKRPAMIHIAVSNKLNDAYLNEIKCPTLLIQSEESFLSPTLLISRMAAVDREKVKVVTVPGGHHVLLYRPEVMNRLINHFLLTKMIHPNYTEWTEL